MAFSLLGADSVAYRPVFEGDCMKSRRTSGGIKNDAPAGKDIVSPVPYPVVGNDT